MKIRVNEKEITFNGSSVLHLLAELKLKPEGVVVELNGKVVNREKYPAEKINENDRLEIVRFVGGG